MVLFRVQGCGQREEVMGSSKARTRSHAELVLQYLGGLTNDKLAFSANLHGWLQEGQAAHQPFFKNGYLSFKSVWPY